MLYPISIHYHRCSACKNGFVKYILATKHIQIASTFTRPEHTDKKNFDGIHAPTFIGFGVF